MRLEELKTKENIIRYETSGSKRVCPSLNLCVSVFGFTEPVQAIAIKTAQYFQILKPTWNPEHPHQGRSAASTATEPLTQFPTPNDLEQWFMAIGQLPWFRDKVGPLTRDIGSLGIMSNMVKT